MGDRLERNMPLDDGFRAKPFVRTRQQPFPPRLWRWEVCTEGDLLLRQSSTCVYRSAHDAWVAGQVALEDVFKRIASQCRANSTVTQLNNQRYKT
jgi:hypothetical protein